MKSLQRIYINRENAILVIVDMENEYCKPGGKKYTKRSARIMPGVISAIHGLAEQARGTGIPIIYIQSVRTLQEPEFTIFGREPISQIGTPAVQIVEELKPNKEDIVIVKFCHDPFFKPDLDMVLQRLVPNPTKHYAILTGGAIQACLFMAVIGFYLRSYWTVLAMDGVYSPSAAGHRRALEQFNEPCYRNVFLSRSDLIEISHDPAMAGPAPTPGM